MLKKIIVILSIFAFVTIIPQIGYCQDLVNNQFVVPHGAYSEVNFRVGILSKGELNGTFQSTDTFLFTCLTKMAMPYSYRVKALSLYTIREKLPEASLE